MSPLDGSILPLCRAAKRLLDRPAEQIPMLKCLNHEKLGCANAAPLGSAWLDTFTLLCPTPYKKIDGKIDVTV